MFCRFFCQFTPFRFLNVFCVFYSQVYVLTTGNFCVFHLMKVFARLPCFVSQFWDKWLFFTLHDFPAFSIRNAFVTQFSDVYVHVCASVSHWKSFLLQIHHILKFIDLCTFLFFTSNIFNHRALTPFSTRTYALDLVSQASPVFIRLYTHWYVVRETKD